jgi:glycerate dehydrogenase
VKIVVLDGYTLNPGDISWSEIEQLGELTVYDRTPESLILERIGDAEIIFTNKTPLTREIIENAPSIRFIGVLATGYNVVDVNAAKENGIPVTNVPAYGTDSVAQFVFALLLEICHHIQKHSSSVLEGKWAKSPDFCYWNFPLIELSGKTMGIIGYGRIGQAVAKIATAFGMKVLAHSGGNMKHVEVENVKLVSLDELLANSDVISLHCPLFDNTKGDRKSTRLNSSHT